MSIEIEHRADAVLVTARSATASHPLPRVSALLAELADANEVVVIDISDVVLAPTHVVTDFLEHVSELNARRAIEIVLVADRLTARQVLRALGHGTGLHVAPSVERALGHTAPTIEPTG